MFGRAMRTSSAVTLKTRRPGTTARWTRLMQRHVSNRCMKSVAAQSQFYTEVLQVEGNRRGSRCQTSSSLARLLVGDHFLVAHLRGLMPELVTVWTGVWRVVEGEQNKSRVPKYQISGMTMSCSFAISCHTRWSVHRK